MHLCGSVDDSIRYLGKLTNYFFCVSNMCPPGWLYLPCLTWAVITSLATRPWPQPRRANANTGTILALGPLLVYPWCISINFFFPLFLFCSVAWKWLQTTQHQSASSRILPPWPAGHYECVACLVSSPLNNNTPLKTDYKRQQEFKVMTEQDCLQDEP